MKCRSRHSGRIERRPKELALYAGLVKATWESACKHDGISPSSKFVVFSNDNPYLPYYEKAVREYREAMYQYQAGGYIGLRLATI